MDLLTEGVYDKGIFKAVFMAGGPGSGKSFIAAQLFGIPETTSVSVSGLSVVNSDRQFKMLLKKYLPISISDSNVPKPVSNTHQTLQTILLE